MSHLAEKVLIPKFIKKLTKIQPNTLLHSKKVNGPHNHVHIKLQTQDFSLQFHSNYLKFHSLQQCQSKHHFKKFSCLVCKQNFMLNGIFNSNAHTGNLHAKYFRKAIPTHYTVNKCQTTTTKCWCHNFSTSKIDGNSKYCKPFDVLFQLPVTVI